MISDCRGNFMKKSVLKTITATLTGRNGVVV
jgi:hypothetical protein